MTLFDLVLILVVVGCILALFVLGYSLFRRQWTRAKRIFLLLGSFLAVYVVVLLSVSFFSPPRVLAMRQNRCFDDWCLSVEQVVQQPTVGIAPTVITAHGVFYLVTMRVSSLARAIPQRALDAEVYLLDARGLHYDPDSSGQQVLNAIGQGGQPLNSELAPSGSFIHTAVFDLPKSSSHLSLVVTHGLFPDVLVIGSDQSFLHKPTIIQLK